MFCVRIYTHTHTHTHTHFIFYTPAGFLFRKEVVTDFIITHQLFSSILYHQVQLMAICYFVSRVSLRMAIIISRNMSYNTNIHEWFEASFAIIMISSLICVVMQGRFVVIYQGFVTTYLSQIQAEETVSPLKTGPAGCPETSVNNQQWTLRNTQEERRSH